MIARLRQASWLTLTAGLLFLACGNGSNTEPSTRAGGGSAGSFSGATGSAGSVSAGSGAGGSAPSAGSGGNAGSSGVAGAWGEAGAAGEGGSPVTVCPPLPDNTVPVAKSGVDAFAQPAYMKRSPDFSVKVNGTPVDVISDLNQFDYAHFSVWGVPATIEVTGVGLTSIGSFSISPLKQNIAGKLAGNTLTYTLPIDQYTIVTLAGKAKKLIVLADPKPSAPPASGDGIYNVVTSYGADPTGADWSTQAIQGAIDAAAAAATPCKPSTVYVPPGKYKISNLTLKSNLNLFMAGGSAFWFSNVQADYRTDWTSKGNGTRWIATAPGTHDLRIFGRGTFDGNALERKNFYNNVLVLVSGERLSVDGIMIRNGSKWGTMVVQSNDVLFNNVKFLQGFGPGEDDGIDIIESQDVTVKYSISVSGDDPFSVKSYNVGGNYVIPDPSGPHEPAKNITFDSDIAWTGCHAFKIGQGVGQDQDTITFKNSVVYDAAHAISLHHKQGDAEARNITWDNIDVERESSSNIGQSWAFVQIEDAKSGIGPVRNLNIRNINVRAVGGGVSNTDIPNSNLAAGMGPIIGIDASNHVDGVFFTNVKINGVLATSPATAHVQANAFVTNLQVGNGFAARVFYVTDDNLAESDWSNGDTKGDCGLGWAATGLSTAPNTGSAHGLRCKNYGVPFNGVQAGDPLTVSTSANNERSSHAGDWDAGYPAVECGTGEYLSGISQNPTTHALGKVRCARAPTKASGCTIRSVTSEDRGEATGDWDHGYIKGECASEQVMVGVSVNPSGNPHRILCCPVP